MHVEVKCKLNGSLHSNLTWDILTRFVIRSNVLGDLLKRFTRAYSVESEENLATEKCVAGCLRRMPDNVRF